MQILELNHISKRYNKQFALHHFTLSVSAGERLVLLGPSGCGKTTLLRLIAGFMAPDSGTIFLNGQMVSKAGRIVVPPEQRNVGMVFQDLALWPHLTVTGNIEFGLKARGLPATERKQRVKQMLQLMGMEDLALRKPAQLSGGQQQRVALARALALKPPLLLMDEPLSSLDLELKVRLRNEILRLQKQLAFTLLYVTHDHEEAFSIATRIVLLKNGEQTFDGAPAEAQQLLRANR